MTQPAGVSLHLPYPPSANSSWRRAGARIILSAKAKAFRAAVCAAVLEEWPGVRYSDPVCVTLIAYPPDKRRRDLDNIIKPTLDALQGAGLIVDDRQVNAISAYRCESRSGGLLIVMVSPHPEGMPC